MKVVKQIYIYVLTYASLVMMLWGAVRIGGLLINLLIGPNRDTILVGRNLRDEFSIAGAMLLVGLLVWAIHWWLAQRSVNAAGPEGQQERRSTFRKLLIYGVLFTAGWQMTFAAAEFVRALLTSLPGDLGSGAMRGVLAYAVPTFIVYGLAWWYYWRIRRVDNEVVAETGHAATVRRWYYYLASYLGLSAVMFALADLTRFTWRTITADSRPWLVGDGWVLLPVATSAGWLLAAGAVWLLQWTTAQRMADGSMEERHSLLRKVYLYGVILQTAAVTLVMATGFVYNLVRMWLGNDQFPAEGELLLPAVLMPLATALAYGIFWAYHWLTLRAEIRAVLNEPGLQISLRGVYSYPIAVVGLSTLAVGLSALLRYLFDIAFNGSATTGLTRAESADQISLFASTLLVGAVAWGATWALLQRTALRPQGAEMRQSLARRVYMYVVMLPSAIAVLISGFWLAYWLFRNVGNAIAPSLVSDIATPLGVLITAGVLLTYHAIMLRGDQRAKVLTPTPVPEVEAAPAAPQALPYPATVVLIRTPDLSLTNAAIEAVRSTVGEHAEVEVLSAPGATAAELSGWLARRAEELQQPVPDVTPTQSETPVEKGMLL